MNQDPILILLYPEDFDVHLVAWAQTQIDQNANLKLEFEKSLQMQKQVQTVFMPPSKNITLQAEQRQKILLMAKQKAKEIKKEKNAWFTIPSLVVALSVVFLITYQREELFDQNQVHPTTAPNPSYTMNQAMIEEKEQEATLEAAMKMKREVESKREQQFDTDDVFQKSKQERRKLAVTAGTPKKSKKPKTEYKPIEVAQNTSPPAPSAEPKQDLYKAAKPMPMARGNTANFESDQASPAKQMEEQSAAPSDAVDMIAQGMSQAQSAPRTTAMNMDIKGAPMEESEKDGIETARILNQQGDFTQALDQYMIWINQAEPSPKRRQAIKEAKILAQQLNRFDLLKKLNALEPEELEPPKEKSKKNKNHTIDTSGF